MCSSDLFVKQGEEGVVASEMISLLIEYGIPYLKGGMMFDVMESQ